MALPTLTFNRSFLQDFIEAESPCFALGLVAVDGLPTGFLGMRPDPAIPDDVLARGFGFGHRLYGGGDTILSQFVLDFHGFARYVALVNPANPMMRRIFETMVDRGEYHFFNLNQNKIMTAFRSEIGDENLIGMRDCLPTIRAAATTADQYAQGIQSFLRRPDPPGQLLAWVCRDNPDYLDLSNDVHALRL